jgi:uncharacterized protein YjbI with pentapeptide repeats
MNTWLRTVLVVVGLHSAGLASTSAAAADMPIEQVRGTLRDASPTMPANLAGKDLSDLDLSGLDFRQADLRGANLFRARLGGADLTGANVEGANLCEADLEKAVLRDLEGLPEAGAIAPNADCR